jgi:uncharacterized protein (DUF169 family)
MTTLEEFHRCGEELEDLLMLRTSPIAVKMLGKEADIPAGAVRPKRDRGHHLAQCQAFALSRRQGATVAMLKEDHWCPAPLIAYGIVERPADNGGQTVDHYTCFESGKYIGAVTAPLKSTAFAPDVVIIYSNTAQLRSLLLSLKMEDRALVESRFFPPSCGYAVVNVMQTGRYWVVLPDPGEHQRALTGEGEMMFSVPAGRLAELVGDLRRFEDRGFAYRNADRLMQPDFARPDFYKQMFRAWGLDDS